MGTDASFNNDPQNGVISPVQQNPTVDVGAWMQGLQLALNTAQTGRVFQDRTHKFYIAENLQTPGTGDLQFAENNILNGNVRGKRGNIVQTFPAVEYDFEPNDIVLVQGQCIHLQWAGSNTHNNGNPAGDGQAGDAGEGRGGSDRSNLMQLLNKNSTYPVPLDTGVVTDFFEESKCYETYTGNAMSSGTTAGAGNTQATADANLAAKDVQSYLLSGGLYPKYANIGNLAALDGNGADELDVLLNNSPASMRGVTCCPQTPGVYTFTCTRNNNFSNRDQKLEITVTN